MDEISSCSEHTDVVVVYGMRDENGVQRLCPLCEALEEIKRLRSTHEDLDSPLIPPAAKKSGTILVKLVPGGRSKPLLIDEE
ncbi:MAG: hypothetical protein Q8K86_07370 [Candidatus Nanopelagicaceae bacterium]|nr:hypothetical protein [Candidatus Nanopelagicaceae bacterium]